MFNKRNKAITRIKQPMSEVYECLNNPDETTICANTGIHLLYLPTTSFSRAATLPVCLMILMWQLHGELSDEPSKAMPETEYQDLKALVTASIDVNVEISMFATCRIMNFVR